MEQVVKNFTRFLQKKRNLKENTVLSYERDIRAFLSFAAQNGLINREDICNSFDAYMEYLHQCNRSESTISRNIASLRCLFRYMKEQGFLTSDPSKGKKYETKKEPSRQYQDLLTTDEIDRLINASKREDVKGYRDTAMLETLYATGLKASDFLNIRLGDLHLKEGYLTVKADGHTRYVPLYKGATKAIRTYLNKARKHLETSPKTDVLFLNLNGQPFSRQGLWKFLKSYAQKADIQKDLTPQLFRHSMAVHLAENGADILVVQELLGHKNIALTKQYLKNFKPKILSDYTKYHPKAQP